MLNKENSWVMWLGDFTGGALNFDEGAEVEGKREWHKIKGHIHHRNDPHEGTQCSIVLCGGTRKQKSRTSVEAKRATCEKSSLSARKVCTCRIR